MGDRDRGGERERETVIALVEELVWGLEGALRLGLKTELVNKVEKTVG